MVGTVDVLSNYYLVKSAQPSKRIDFLIPGVIILVEHSKTHYNLYKAFFINCSNIFGCLMWKTISGIYMV